jgi:hypothetical protein
MSNVEPGISNDEVKSLLLFPSAFIIRYSIFYGSLLSSYASYTVVFRSRFQPNKVCSNPESIESPHR